MLACRFAVKALSAVRLSKASCPGLLIQIGIEEPVLVTDSFGPFEKSHGPMGLQSEYTHFSRDTLGRWICNALDEALGSTSEKPFDLIVIGEGPSARSSLSTYSSETGQRSATACTASFLVLLRRAEVTRREDLSPVGLAPSSVPIRWHRTPSAQQRSLVQDECCSCGMVS
jgi:hypothetical protein